MSKKAVVVNARWRYATPEVEGFSSLPRVRLDALKVGDYIACPPVAGKASGVQAKVLEVIGIHPELALVELALSWIHPEAVRVYDTTRVTFETIRSDAYRLFTPVPLPALAEVAPEESPLGSVESERLHAALDCLVQGQCATLECLEQVLAELKGLRADFRRAWLPVAEREEGE